MPIKIEKWQCSICGKIWDNREIQCRDCEESHPKIERSVPFFKAGQTNPCFIRVFYADRTSQDFHEEVTATSGPSD